MIHKIFHGHKHRIHAWELRNVRVACRTTLKQAQPVDRSVAFRSEMCESCDAMKLPRNLNTLYVKEAQEDAAPQAPAQVRAA